MEGGQFRDSFVLRLTLAVTCAALMALVAAPVAMAGAPATDQYGSALPSGGNNDSASSGDSSTGSSGTAATPGGEVTIPVDESGSQTPTDETSAGGKPSGKSNAKGDTNVGDPNTPSRHGAVVGDSSSSHSVPQIASNTAGDGWVPFFIAAMVALACAAAALVYRNRRRTAQS
jgi:hypothetical protein